jgi:hypothetical protein
MAVIDLSQLPAPDVVETLDFETILAERKATLISLYPEDEQEAVARTLTLESEPLVKYLEENAYREVILRQRINEAAKPEWWPMPSKTTSTSSRQIITLSAWSSPPETIPKSRRWRRSWNPTAIYASASRRHLRG